jgi:hypothetical protein
MKINRCPKCGQEPAIAKIVDYCDNKFGYEVGCYDFEIQTEVIKTREEAVAKWNEMTEERK